METLEVKSVFYWAYSLVVILNPKASVSVEFKSTCFNLQNPSDLIN